jgi:hypothetical protein
MMKLLGILSVISMAIMALGVNAQELPNAGKLSEGIVAFNCNIEEQDTPILLINNKDGWSAKGYLNLQANKVGEDFMLRDANDASFVAFIRNNNSVWSYEQLSQKGSVKADCKELDHLVDLLVSVITPKIQENVISLVSENEKLTGSIAFLEQENQQKKKDIADSQAISEQLNKKLSKLNKVLSQVHYENTQLNTKLTDLKAMERAANYQETRNKKLTEDLSQAKYDLYILTLKLKKSGNSQLNTKLTDPKTVEKAADYQKLTDLKTMERAADYQETRNKKLTEDLSQAKYDIYILKQKLKKAGID